MQEKLLDFSRNPEKCFNLFEDFEAGLAAILAVEAEMSDKIDEADRNALRDQIREARGMAMEKREQTSPEEMSRFKKRVVAGFQGLGGFNRYIIRGDGTVGLAQSHSTGPYIKKAQELGIETPEFEF